MELFRISQSHGGSFDKCICEGGMGGGGLSFASFHWTAKSRLLALKDAGGRSLSWLCGPGVRRGEKRRAASSWCWLSGFSSGAAASPSPSGPRPAPSWLGTAPLSSIRSPPPAATNDKVEEERPQGGASEFRFAIRWRVKTTNRAEWKTVKAKLALCTVWSGLKSRRPYISNNRKKKI